MQQAIRTTMFHDPDTGTTRVVAQCQAGTRRVLWDHALNVAENHIAAARALCDKLGWDFRLVSGAGPFGEDQYFHCLDR